MWILKKINISSTPSIEYSHLLPPLNCSKSLEDILPGRMVSAYITLANWILYKQRGHYCVTSLYNQSKDREKRGKWDICPLSAAILSHQGYSRKGLSKIFKWKKILSCQRYSGKVTSKDILKRAIFQQLFHGCHKKYQNKIEMQTNGEV